MAREATASSALDALPQPLVCCDKAGAITFANRSWELETGHPAASALGRPFGELVVEAAARGVIPADGERVIALRHADGSLVRYVLREHPDGEGQVYLLRRWALDATTRAVLDQSPLSTVVFWPDGAPAYANDAFLASLRVDRAAFHAHMQEYSILDDPQIEALGILDRVRAAFAGEIVKIPPMLYDPTRSADLPDSEPRPRWLASHLYPVRDAAGRVAQVVMVHVDVTAERQAREARQHLDSRLQLAQRMESLGVLAGGLAHDFNNLLTGVLGNAELLQMTLPEQAPAQKRVAAIHGAAQRAAGLCRQMLAFAGRGQFAVRPVDVSMLVRDVLPRLRERLPPSIELEQQLGDGLPLVEADASQLEQVLIDLVDNANDAIEGPGVVRISTGVTTYRGHSVDVTGLAEPVGRRCVYIKVRDSGSGMDAAVRARIFEPFFTTRFTGRGLGLAAALGVVRGLHGGIEVDSTPGGGTTISVLLPFERSDGPGARAELAGPAHEGDGLVVLVVDDQEVVREVVRRTLELFGYSVVEADDGIAALDALRRVRVDVVLLDLFMPRMGGAEVLREMRQIGVTAPVVVTSGFSEEAALRRVRLPARSEFLQKPFRPDALLEALRRLLSGPA